MKRVRKSRPKAIQDDDDEVEWDQDQLQGSGDDDDGSAYEVRLHSRTIYAVRAPIAVHRFYVHTLQQYQVPGTAVLSNLCPVFEFEHDHEGLVRNAESCWFGASGVISMQSTAADS